MENLLKKIFSVLSCKKAYTNYEGNSFSGR